MNNLLLIVAFQLSLYDDYPNSELNVATFYLFRNDFSNQVLNMKKTAPTMQSPAQR